jgi:DNA-binding MarR family transcriptional regulator
MLVANFNLSSNQLQVLLAFRMNKDTRSVGLGDHPLSGVHHNVATLKKLCQEGYLEWHDGSFKEGNPPGYSITSKGEMMLRIVEEELRRNIAWFDGNPLPESEFTGAKSDVATGKGEVTAKGKYRRRKPA